MTSLPSVVAPNDKLLQQLQHVGRTYSFVHKKCMDAWLLPRIIDLKNNSRYLSTIASHFDIDCKQVDKYDEITKNKYKTCVNCELYDDLGTFNTLREDRQRVFHGVIMSTFKDMLDTPILLNDQITCVHITDDRTRAITHVCRIGITYRMILEACQIFVPEICNDNSPRYKHAIEAITLETSGFDQLNKTLHIRVKFQKTGIYFCPPNVPSDKLLQQLQDIGSTYSFRHMKCMDAFLLPQITDWKGNFQYLVNMVARFDINPNHIRKYDQHVKNKYMDAVDSKIYDNLGGKDTPDGIMQRLLTGVIMTKFREILDTPILFHNHISSIFITDERSKATSNICADVITYRDVLETCRVFTSETADECDDDDYENPDYKHTVEFVKLHPPGFDADTKTLHIIVELQNDNYT
jgi:hypothetical protein